MAFTKSLTLFTAFLASALLVAQDDEKLLSGPAPGKFVPASFECMNLNGPAKGRPRCLVCKFALSPVVLVFTKEPAEGKDEPLNEFIKQLEEAVAEYHDERGFSVGVIFLSPDARDSTNNVEEKDSEKIIEEALGRKRLTERLTKRAEGLKHVVIAYYAEAGPKGFNINPKAEQTVIFYERMKVIENWAYAPEKMEAKDVDVMMKRVRGALPTVKKKVDL